MTNGANGHKVDKEREEADAHLEKYVTDQLQRISTGGDTEAAVYEDEFEAQLDN